LIPSQADVVIKVENPRQLAEAVINLDALKELQKFDVVKEYYNSTSVKRFYQLVAYFEKQLGAKQYDLVDKLAGGGLALGGKIDAKPKAVLVIQGRDEQAVQLFVEAGLKLVQEELARQGKKEKIDKGMYQNIETFSVGPEFRLARVGATLVIANHPDALQTSLDLHLNKGGQSVLDNKGVVKARKMLPPKMLAWAWLNLESVRKIPDTKEFFASPEKVSQLNVTAFGGFINVAKRSAFVCAGLYQKDNRFTFTVQFPEGTKGMPDLVGGWFPQGKGTSLPLLEPPNVLSSTSYYLDLAEFWKNRAKVLMPNELKGLEDVDKQAGPFLAGVKIGDLLQMSGSHQRIVVTQPTTSLYQRKSKVTVQSFALVHEMRDQEFAKKVDRVVRIGAVILTAQFNLELVEEDYKGVPIVTYKFPENKELKDDTLDIRFAFSPSYAWVGNQFIASSTRELCKDLIDVLQKEKNPKTSPVMLQSKFYSTGISAGLKGAEQEVLAQFVLSQGISLDKAKQELGKLTGMLDRLGTAQIETLYAPNSLKINFNLNLGK